MKKLLSIFGMLTLVTTVSTSVIACNPNNSEDINNNTTEKINVFIEAKNESGKSVIENTRFMYGSAKEQITLYDFTVSFAFKDYFSYSPSSWGNQLNTINGYEGDFINYYWGIFSDTDPECKGQVDFSCMQGVDGLKINPEIQNYYWFSLTKINMGEE